MTTENNTPKGLAPDDIRVNPELHKLVYEAVKAVNLEEQANLDLVKRPLHLIGQRLKATRNKVVADYLADHPDAPRG